MSVRSSILAVLTLGPAYGLQVHAEIETRSARAGDINVGQIYSTLARLKSSRSVEVRASTPDGFPLYELTRDGRVEAERWLTTVQPVPRPSWSDMVNHVLLAASLPAADVHGLVTGYRAAWAGTPAATTSISSAELMKIAAESALASAAHAWLDEFEGTTFVHANYAAARPKRGRRPSPSREHSQVEMSAAIR